MDVADRAASSGRSLLLASEEKIRKWLVVSKNKRRDSKSSEIDDDSLPATVDDGSLSSDPLLEEVQQFLSKRAELANRLSQEIEATEKKLIELKRTVAMLFPETESTPVSKERKAKKPSKTKPTKTAAEKGETTDAVTTVED